MADTLSAGESLSVGQSIQSQNRRFSLIMQADGNLVLYQGAPSIESAIWSAQTAGLDPLRRPTRLVVQEDGNVVLLSNFDNPAWDSATNGARGASLVLQDDGNLVIYGQADGFNAYNAYGAAQDAVVWASNTTLLEADPQVAEGDFPLWVDTGEVEVAWAKRMRTWGHLYRNGLFRAITFTKNDHYGAGLRGQVLVVCVDGAGRAIWVSQVFHCPTRCSIFDWSCASYGSTLLSEDFPEEVGRLSVRLDVYQTDTQVFGDLRISLCNAIKAAQPMFVAAGGMYAELGKKVGEVLQCE
jgi:hypothetical protein